MTIRGGRKPHVVPITAPSFPLMPKSRIYRNIAYTFIGLTVVILLSVLWLSSVRADVIVRVRHDETQLQTSVELARAPTSGQMAARIVQGVFESSVQEIQLKTEESKSESVVIPPPSTTSSTPVTVVAKGEVRLINTLPRPLMLIDKTRLFSPDRKLYRMNRRANIPANGEARVNVFADKPGEEFAIGPTRFTIPGLSEEMQKMIYAVSDKAFVAVPQKSFSVDGVVSQQKKSTINTSKVKPLTRAMIEEATRTLKETTLEQAKRALAAEVSDPRLNEVIYLVTSSTKTNVSPGQEASSFLASVKVDVTAVYYPKEDMLTLLRTKLKEKIPSGREFLPFTPGSVTFKLTAPDTKEETAVLEATAVGKYRLSPASPLLQKSVIAGRSSEEVLAILKSLDGVEDVQINIRPRWLKKLPALKDRIELRIE